MPAALARAVGIGAVGIRAASAAAGKAAEPPLGKGAKPTTVAMGEASRRAAPDGASEPLWSSAQNPLYFFT
jgi:hypothetical protein